MIKNNQNAGYTLIELIVIVMIVGILSSIVPPVWAGFVNNQRLEVGGEEVFRAMEEAKSHAKRDKITWQISFKDDGRVKYAIHPVGADMNKLNWIELDKDLRISDPSVINTDTNDTTFYYHNTYNIWRMQFNYHGHANGQIGKITLTTRNGGNSKRCVIVSTLLGAMRKAQNQSCSS